MKKQNFGSISPPTLLGPIPTHETPSMLSSLEEGQSTSRKSKRGRPSAWLVVFLLTGLVVGGVIMIANKVTTSVKPVNVPVSKLIDTTPPKVTKLAESDTPPESDSPTQAATIVTDVPAQETKAETTTKSSNDPHDRLSAALEGKPLIPQATTKQSSGTKTTAKSKNIKTAKKQKPHNQKTHKAKSKHAHPNENDIKLLAALVASTNQDVVVRKPGDTTASLLKRCEMLGSLEGSLCSKRICSGQWQNDPACVAYEKAKNTSVHK